MKISSILGLNARTQLFAYKYNGRHGKRVADSKLQSAKVLALAGIPVPAIYTKFKKPEDILSLDWESLPSSFALKPSRGFGGEGIIVVRRRASKASGGWITTQRRRVSRDDLKLQVLDILEGAYSLGNVPDVAFVQEFVGRHKAFRRYAYRGTPDVRVIVFNKVPVMAMTRLPTKESGGRANIHQGAIAVGIDIATGITTKAIWHGDQISLKPGSNIKLRGIKIPDWTSILEIASRAQEASGLGYVGVDIVIHPEKGPLVLELNAQPGLQIQLANMSGLKKRIERVEDLEVRDAEHGVKIAKALFVERFVDRLKAEEGIKTVHIFEDVKLKGSLGKKIEVAAKLDTGAWRTSIDSTLAKSQGLLKRENILWYKKVRNSHGVTRRPVIDLTFWLAGRKIVTNANIANREALKKKIVIGRKALKGFLVSPEPKIQ